MRSSPPSAVVPSETMRSPSRRGLAPAQSGTVSRWVENSRRGPGRVPGRSTIRLPVSVGSGMRLLASSKRIAEAGTPTFFSASLTAAAIVASWPVTPSTERNRIRCSSAAATSRGTAVLLMVSIQSAMSCIGFVVQARVGRHSPQGRPSICQTAKSTVHSTNIQTT